MNKGNLSIIKFELSICFRSNINGDDSVYEMIQGREIINNRNKRGKQRNRVVLRNTVL